MENDGHKTILFKLIDRLSVLCFMKADEKHKIDVEDLKNDLKFVIETTGLKEDYDKWLKEKPFINSNFK